jgi:outer membrane protein
MKTAFSVVAASLLALAVCGGAWAQANSLQVGWVNIDPRSTAGTVVGPYTPPNALSAKVQPKSTVFLSLVHEIDDHFDLQLASGVPPKHEATLVVVNPAAVPAAVAAQNGVVIAKLTQAAPTLFVNYKFGASASAFRPFVGLGVNYTRFTGGESTPINDALNGGPTTVRLSDSTGPAAQIGVVATLNRDWYLTAVWATAKVKTTITTNTQGIERTLDVKFRPSAVTLALGYRF